MVQDSENWNRLSIDIRSAILDFLSECVGRVSVEISTLCQLKDLASCVSDAFNQVVLYCICFFFLLLSYSFSFCPVSLDLFGVGRERERKE